MPSPNLEGNSVIVDTLNFEGLWTDAFSDAIIERAPFFNDVARKVGYIDLMKIKRRVKMAYMPTMNSKILELPVGFGSRFRMLFTLSLRSTQVKQSISELMDTVFFEILDNLKESIIPLEVAIPRFRMTTEIKMRSFLEEMGVKTLWTDVEGTRYIFFFFLNVFCVILLLSMLNFNDTEAKINDVDDDDDVPSSNYSRFSRKLFGTIQNS